MRGQSCGALRQANDSKGMNRTMCRVQGHFPIASTWSSSLGTGQSSREEIKKLASIEGM